MGDPRVKYRIEMTTARGERHVLDGECRSFVFATEGQSDAEEIVFIGTSPDRAAVLIAGLFHGLETVCPPAGEAILEGLNRGLRPSIKEIRKG